MKIFFRRILAMVLISLGISMTFLPFNYTRSGSIDREVVYLEKVELLNPEKIRAQFPDEEIIDITGPELNEEDYPELWRDFIYLDTTWVNDTCNVVEWNRFQDSFFNKKKEFRLVVFRDALISCSAKNNEANPDMASFFYLGKYNTHIQELSDSDLKKYKTIIKAIENVNFGKESFSEFTLIPKVEWDKMVKRYLNPIEDSQTFKYKGIFYGPAFAWDTIWKTGTVSNLKTILKVIGIVLLLFGITTLVSLYFSKNMKGISPPRITILLDAITLLFAIPSAYMSLNLLLSKILFIPPIIEDEFLLFMGVFFFFVGIPALAKYISKYASTIAKEH